MGRRLPQGRENGPRILGPSAIPGATCAFVHSRTAQRTALPSEKLHCALFLKGFLIWTHLVALDIFLHSRHGFTLDPSSKESVCGQLFQCSSWFFSVCRSEREARSRKRASRRRWEGSASSISTWSPSAPAAISKCRRPCRMKWI